MDTNIKTPCPCEKSLVAKKLNVSLEVELEGSDPLNIANAMLELKAMLTGNTESNKWNLVRVYLSEQF